MNQKPLLLPFVISLLLLLALPVAAQTPTPPTPTSQLAVLSSKIVNRSPGGTVPGKLDLVLHAWDQNSAEKLMLDGQSNPDGTFEFKDVPLEVGLSYGAMAVYDGITYFSTPVLAEGQPITNLEIPIYETTTDTSSVQIDQRYVMFLYTTAGLRVTEVYFVSNRGDRTVKDAVQLADGQRATLQFPLPAEAINLAYDPATKEQFVQTPGGFAYTGPLLAGGQPSRLILRYGMPYRSGMTYTVQATYLTQAVNFLVESDSGLTVTGDSLTDGGTEKINKTRSAIVMKHGLLSAGEKASVTLAGQPKVSNLGQPISAARTLDSLLTPQMFLGLAGLILAVGLAVFGWWWYRRPEPVLAEIEEPLEVIGAETSTPVVDPPDANSTDAPVD